MSPCYLHRKIISFPSCPKQQSVKTLVVYLASLLLISTSSSLSPTGALIPLISSNSNNTPLFPLDVVNDETLLATWHDIVLPAISSQKDKFRGLRSVHLLRRGSTKLVSIPTIYVTYDDSSRVKPLHESISTLFGKEAMSSTQVSFEKAALRRTVTQEDPPICRPRNTLGQLIYHLARVLEYKAERTVQQLLGGFSWWMEALLL